MYRDPRQHPPVPWRWPDLLKALAAAAVVFFAAIILVQLGRAPLRVLEQYLMHQGLAQHVYLLILSSLVAYVAAVVALALFIVRPYHVSWATLGYRSVPALRFAIPLLAYPVTVFVAGDVRAGATGGITVAFGEGTQAFQRIKREYLPGLASDDTPAREEVEA